jgi:hypothetical protein
MNSKAAAAAAGLFVAACVSIPDLVSAPADGGGGRDAGVDAPAQAPPDAAREAASDAASIPDGDGSVPCPGKYAEAVSALPGLLAYWRLDEATGTVAGDMTGKHPWTYKSAVVLGQPGLLVGDTDLAIDLVGDAGSYVDIPTDHAFDLQQFTIGAIIRPSAILAAAVGQQIVARPFAYWLQLDAPTNSGSDPRIEVGLITPAPKGYPEAQVSAALGVGLTSHVIGTYDGNAVVAYVNGKLVESAPLQVTIATPANDLYVGSWDGTSNLQTGIVDEVFVVGRALGPAEVQGLYEAAQGCASGATD